jgi:hypothetical protein
MKQVKLTCLKGGRVKIDAHGTFGEGTSEFTMSLANDLGEIIERHKGSWHQHVESLTQNEVRVEQKI